MSRLVAIGTDNGAILLRQAGDHTEWRLVSHGLQGRRVVCLMAHPDGSLWAAAANGAVYRTRDLDRWSSLVEGIRASGVHSLSVHPAKPEVIFAGAEPASIFKSTDGGQTWRALPTFTSAPGAGSWTLPHPPYRPVVRSLVHHPHEPDVLFAGVHVGGLMASLDGGRTWTERHGGLGREVNSLVLHRAAPARLLAATGSGFYRSEDLGGSWFDQRTGLPYLFARSLAVDTGNADRLMLAVSQRRDGGGAAVCRSSDGGQSWQVCVNGFPPLVEQAVTALTTEGGLWYAVTDGGELFTTENFGTLWVKLRTGMPPARAVLAFTRRSPR